jgi:DNA topoisomerase-1
MKSLSGKAKKIKESMVEETDEACDKCGRPMVIRWGRNGRFMACSGYPECKNTKPLADDERSMEVDDKCDECGSPMVVKEGRFGKFLGCSRYPECKFTKAFTTGADCPKEKCDGEIVERKSRKGRTFYGCTNYPKCNFVSWYKPVNIRCEKCGNPYLVEKETKAKGFHYACPECKAITYPQESPQSVTN